MGDDFKICKLRRCSGKTAHALKTRRVDRHIGLVNIHAELFCGTLKKRTSIGTVVHSERTFFLQLADGPADVARSADRLREKALDSHFSPAERRHQNLVFCGGCDLFRLIHALLIIADKKRKRSLFRRGRGKRIGRED